MSILQIERKGYYFDKTIMASGHESSHHYHESFEIYLLLSGEVNYFIGERSYLLMPGDLVLIPKDTIHRTNYRSVKHSRLLINCPEDIIPAALIARIAERGNLFRNEEILPKLEGLFFKIEEEYMRFDELSEKLLFGYTLELAALILRNESTLTDKPSDSHVTGILEYIKNNYMNEIRLGDLAAKRGISCEHLCRIFKSETGFGFAEYLNMVRLEVAHNMLKNEPGKAISEVAYSSGFNDSNYFSYKFKEMYGVSPSKVKRQ